MQPESGKPAAMEASAPTGAPQDLEAPPPAYSPRSEPGPASANPNAAQSPPFVTTQPPLQQHVPKVTPLKKLGTEPQWIDCPFCKRRTMTRITKEGTAMQIVTGVLCGVFCICLACVPCLAGWFEETIHYCSQCNGKVAKRFDNGAVTVFVPNGDGTVPSQYAVASGQGTGGSHT